MIIVYIDVYTVAIYDLYLYIYISMLVVIEFFFYC